MPNLEFKTEQYKFAHGHAPRGRGNWAFIFNGSREPWFAPGFVLYSEAKKLARAEGRTRKASSAIVAS